MTEEPQTYSVSKAEEIVKAAQKQRMAEFSAAFEALMEQYGMALVAEPYFTQDGRVLARPRFLPRGQ